MKTLLLSLFVAASLLGCGTPATTPAKTNTNTGGESSISNDLMASLREVTNIVKPKYSQMGYVEPDYPLALSKLEKLHKHCKKRCNNYEKAAISRVSGYTYFQLDDKENSLRYYVNVIEQSPDIPASVELEALSIAASLALEFGDNARAKKYANRFVALSKTEPNRILYIKAALKFDEGDYSTAHTLVKTAIQRSESKSERAYAPEEWYRLLLKIYTTTGTIKGLKEVREKLQKAKAIKNAYRPIIKTEAEYPQSALQLGIQGTCTVVFTVTKAGKTEDLQIAKCSHPIFELNSLTAASRLIYKPKYVKGKAVEVPRVSYRFTFQAPK